MPEQRPERIGELFHHRDPSIHRGAPTICRSVDISDQVSDKTKVRTVSLEYGYGGDRYLYVEIRSLQVDGGALSWPHPCFKVKDIRVPFDGAFAQAAERLGFKPKRLAVLIRSQAAQLSEYRHAA